MTPYSWAAFGPHQRKPRSPLSPESPANRPLSTSVKFPKMGEKVWMVGGGWWVEAGLDELGLRAALDPAFEATCAGAEARVKPVHALRLFPPIGRDGEP